MSIRVGVVGAAGYVGSEMCRWVLAHPDMTLSMAVSRSRVGKPLSSAVPALLGATDLCFSGFEPEALCALDVVILATPHGAAAGLAAQLSDAPVLLDCSRDHRHAVGWVFGQPEWHAEQLVGAKRIAAPGCFATALMLSAAPFVDAGVVAGDIQVVAATGSTGSGASASAATHHPERFVNLKAYKVLTHQHVPEVLTFLAGLGAQPTVNFVPWSAPVDRGIFATSFIPMARGTDAASVVEAAYGNRRFIRLRDGTPQLRHVRGTAFCDISVHQDGDTAVVLAAIDNLGRGAAAQAMQALNLALGLREDAAIGVFAATP
jgi:N-acetyl-gamma-glutamyl-phosphate reductase common form